MALILTIKRLIVLLLIVNGDSCSFLINIDAANITDLCTESARLFWKFTWRYFENKYAIKILAFMDGTSTELSSEIITCGVRNYQLPTQYQSTWNMTDELEKRNLSKYERIHEVSGMVYIAESIHNVDIFISAIDQRAKSIIILQNGTIQDAKVILIYAWREFQLLDLIIYHEETINVTKHLYISVYNPFVIKNGTRGFVHTFKNTDRILGTMNERLFNVDGYPLKIFQYIPDKNCLSLDCMLLYTMAEFLHFKMEVSYCRTYMDQVQENCSDVRHINMREDAFSEFLYPVQQYDFTFITPKARSTPIISFLEIFDPIVSIMLTLAYVTIVITWKFLQFKSNSRTLMDICLVTFGNFLLISQPVSKRNYERCLLSGWIFFSMIICFSYQGTMVEHLVPAKLKDINTLNDLANRNDLAIIVSKLTKKAMEGIAENEDTSGSYRKLLKRAEIISDGKTPKEAKKIAAERNAAAACYIERCRMFKAQIYSNITGEDLVHIVKERVLKIYISYLVPVYSPYKRRFDEVLMKFSESGLATKWTDDFVFNETIGALLERSNFVDGRLGHVYEMKHLSFIFWSWFGCCGFAFVVFLLELFSVYFFK